MFNIKLLTALLAVMLWVSSVPATHASSILEVVQLAYEAVDKEADSVREMEKQLPGDSSELMEGYQCVAALCMLAGRMKEAEEWQTKLINARQKEQPRDLEKLAHAYELMGNICALQLAAQERQWMLQKKREEPELPTEEFLRHQIDRAAPFEEKRRAMNAQATLWRTKAIQLQEQAGARTSLKYGYSDMASSCLVREDYDEALTWMYKAKPIQEEESDYVFSLYEDIGKIYIVQGKFALAEIWLKKSLQAAEKNASHRRASLYEKLSKSALLEGDFVKALRSKQQAMSLRLEEEWAVYAKKQRELEQSYSEMGEKKRAQQAALAAEQQKPKKDTQIKMWDSRALGRIYYQMGDMKQAAAYQEEALALAIDNVKDSPGEVGRYYYELGRSYRASGNQEAAKYNLDASAKAVLAAWGKNKSGHYANWLSKIYIEQSDYDKALEWKLKGGIDAVIAPDDLRAVNYYRELGELYGLRGERKKAAFWLDKAAAVQKNYAGDAAKVAVIYPMGYDR